MDFTNEGKAGKEHVELKYCERCGGLFLRECGAGVVYCAGCDARRAAEEWSGGDVSGRQASIAASPTSERSKCRQGRIARKVDGRVSEGSGGSGGEIMLSTDTRQSRRLMGAAELPPSVLYAEAELDLWPYRSRTVTLLRRYARAAIEVGRLPSLLGREFFRSRVSSRSRSSFEDTVVFVTDIERTLEELDGMEKKLVVMYVLEEYTIPEIARLLSCSERTAERLLHDTVDQVSRLLLARQLLEKLPDVRRGG